MVFQIMSKGIKQIIEAHRGSSGYAHENTIAAFELAHKQEADAIELDIRKTKDNDTFRIDQCVDEAVFVVRVTDESGTQYDLRRNYCY